MTKYTLELREYIESFSHLNTTHFPLSHAEKIEIGRSKLFDFDYPIFDENYKQEFETHFIREFYMREIGFETMGLFKFRLENWMIINMPYWNKMFESELLQYNPLNNAKMDVTHNKKNENTQNASANGTGHSETNQTNQHDSQTGTDTTNNETATNFSRQLESDNPDSRLSITENNDGTGVIEYANGIEENSGNNSRNTTSHSGGTNSSTDTTNATSDSNSSQSSNATTNENEDFIQHREGKIGVQTYAKMIQEHRDVLIRIEKMIFNEMQELFMLVY